MSEFIGRILRYKFDRQGLRGVITIILGVRQFICHFQRLCYVLKIKKQKSMIL